MILDGQQRKKLQTALIDAFPNQSSLKQMVSFGLNKYLEAIAGGDNLQVIFCKLGGYNNEITRCCCSS